MQMVKVLRNTRDKHYHFPEGPISKEEFDKNKKLNCKYETESMDWEVSIIKKNGMYWLRYYPFGNKRGGESIYYGMTQEHFKEYVKGYSNWTITYRGSNEGL